MERIAADSNGMDYQQSNCGQRRTGAWEPAETTNFQIFQEFIPSK